MIRVYMYLLPLNSNMPKIFTGVSSLLHSLTTWLYGIIPVTCGLFLAYHAWMKSMATESADIAARNESMKRVIIYGCIGLSANALINWITGYVV